MTGGRGHCWVLLLRSISSSLQTGLQSSLMMALEELALCMVLAAGLMTNALGVLQKNRDRAWISGTRRCCRGNAQRRKQMQRLRRHRKHGLQAINHCEKERENKFSNWHVTCPENECFKQIK